ncbi:MAG: hypothetical protein M3281_08020 [Chloroflexota bacterium]|nr:hypothetical protein [Chloroflexota bacterium]
MLTRGSAAGPEVVESLSDAQLLVDSLHERAVRAGRGRWRTVGTWLIIAGAALMIASLLWTLLSR